MYYSVYMKSFKLSSYQPVGALQWGCALQNFTVWVSCYAAGPGKAESDSWRLQHDRVQGRRGVEGVWLSVLGRGGSLHPVPEASREHPISAEWPLEFSTCAAKLLSYLSYSVVLVQISLFVCWRWRPVKFSAHRNLFKRVLSIFYPYIE